MQRLPVLALTVLALGSAAGPAFAQHSRLEEAWGVCAHIAGAGNPETALVSSATRAGFPRLEQNSYGFSGAGSQMLVLLIERPLDGVAHCAVRHAGGAQADLIARAARFWEARGYVATQSPSAVYAAVEDEDFTSVSLRAKPPGVWTMSVEWDLD